MKDIMDKAPTTADFASELLEQLAQAAADSKEFVILSAREMHTKCPSLKLLNPLRLL